MNPRPRLLLTISVLLLVGGLVLTADVWGRAGGGGGYSGGGGGGGGFSGGGGGGGSSFHTGSGGGQPITAGSFFFFLVIVIIIVTASAIAQKKGRTAYQGSVIRRGGKVLSDRRRATSVRRLQASDPAFNEPAFCGRVAVAFQKIQRAWCEQALEPMRPFVSDGIFERFSLQVAEQQDLGYRDHMDNIQVHRVQLAQVLSDTPFDTLTVRVDASAIDYRESLATGRRISGSGVPSPFAEYWTFLRRHGVQTADGPGLIEGSCPNCGTEIALNQSAKCSSCDSVLRSGQYDWVLIEITQECEWQLAEPAQIPGAPEYRAAHDPGFNVPHLEDRASVIFWRKAMADRLGDVRPLAKVATADFCERYRGQLEAGKMGRRYRGDCAVGAVQVIGVLAGEMDTRATASAAEAVPVQAIGVLAGKLDRALVEIRWSGAAFQAGPDGRPQRTSESALLRHVFVLGRRGGAQTDVGQSISSAHCPGCGAPESNVAADACEFCGAVLNDGARDWVLLDVFPPLSREVTSLVEEIRAQTPVVAEAVAEPAPTAAAAPGGTHLLAWAIKMALADNQLDPKERELLGRVARHRHVPPRQLDRLIEAARNGDFDVPEPSTPDETRVWLQTMADVSLSDGRVDPAEYQLLCRIGQRLNYSSHDIKQLLRKRQTELYQQARRHLRQDKMS